ncbi:hypothetical protein SAMN05421548_12943 [Paraburkholderia lycopersici]|uniref:Uncharacterized protein n=1 Tax=Paraburkholderia lycopersici TaxID=416944 RepID=A0A1G6Z149_9BURK|nr:hypothetical protein SAMN05421548_12943 [Paraburkholderia lycopersici]
MDQALKCCETLVPTKGCAGIEEMSRKTVRIKKGRGNTRAIVRHVYSKIHGRTPPVNIASIRIDADPDDFQASIRMTRPTKATAWVDPALRKLYQDDLDCIRAWLIQNGDPKAAARRQARFESIARQARKRVEDASAADGNVLVRLPGLLKEAGVFLSDRHKEYAERERDFWADHRSLFRCIVEAYEAFHESAKVVGLVKGSRARG